MNKKQIIFITLTCFVLLIIIPFKTWGAIAIDGEGRSGTPCCDEYDLVCTTPNDFNSCTWKCVKWDTTSPGCGGGSGGGNGGGSEKERGWKCLPSGDCESYKSTHPQYSTLAQCQVNCKPSGTYYTCRKPNFGERGYLLKHNQYLCLGNKWEGTPKRDQCSSDAQCQNPTTPPTTIKYTCNTSTWKCVESSSGPYTSLSTCEANCKAPSSTARYRCNTSNWTCVVDSSGSYTSLSTCQANCKAPSSPPSYSTTYSSLYLY